MLKGHRGYLIEIIEPRRGETFLSYQITGPFGPVLAGWYFNETLEQLIQRLRRWVDVDKDRPREQHRPPGFARGRHDTKSGHEARQPR